MRLAIVFVVMISLLLSRANAMAQPTNNNDGITPPGGSPPERPVLIDDRAPAAEPLPPPQMDDPGTTAAAPPAERPALPSPDDNAPLPQKIPPPPGDELPGVTIRTEEKSGDVVEEYRQNGRLTMVRVKPLHGPPYMLLDTNGDGKLDTKDGEGPVRPVYWTLYEWD